MLKAYGDDSDLVATPFMLGHAMPGWAAGLSRRRHVCVLYVDPGQLSLLLVQHHFPRHRRTIDRKIDAERFQMRATRIGIVIIALYELYWGLIYEGKEDVWDYLAVSGSIYFCSGIVLMAGGLYWKRATRRGALWALILGFTAVLGLAPLKSAVGLDMLSGPMIGFGAIGLSILGFVVGSLTDTQRSNP